MRTSASWVVALLAFPSLAGAQDPDYDVILSGGHVLDGTGNPWFQADVAVEDGRIAAVGSLEDASAERVVDVSGQIVAPGFIDIHSHAGGSLTEDDPELRAAPNLVHQGITTVVINQDGRSPWPIREQREALEETDFGPNVLQMVGHGPIRQEAMDETDREATEEEVEEMRRLTRQAMEEGAVGVSAALEYNPGRYAETDELVAVVEEIAPRDGVYISHQRSEGSDPMWWWPSQDEPGPPNLLDSVLETIEIGERSGAVVVASHIKAKGAHYWGSGEAAIRLIDEARDRGVRIYADQYSYNTTGSDGNTNPVPGWAYARGEELLEEDMAGDGGELQDVTDADRLERILEEPEYAEKVRKDVAHEIQRRGGVDGLVLVRFPDDDLEGLTLAEVAERWDVDAVEAAIELQFAGDPDTRSGGQLRGFSLWEGDIVNYMEEEWVAAASDAGIALPGEGLPHARFYGNFPRKIAHYARDEEVLSVADAVRSATTLPARIMGLSDRGMVTEGHHADLVVFDLEELEDRTTFFDPHQYPEGVEYVFVGGSAVVDEGELTWERPGALIGPEDR